MKVSRYEIVVLTFFIMSIYGIYLLISNSDWLWLLVLWAMIRFNHLCLSLHHRLISHRSFETGSSHKKNLIILMSVLQVNHSPLKFAISHRHHHKNSDSNNDIHGPSVGISNTLLWEFFLEEKFKRLGMKIPRDLLRDKFLIFFDKHYYKILGIISLLIYIASYKFFWYVFVPASVLWKIEANLFVNWYCHKYGYKNYTLENDNARNNRWVAFMTMGEGWHNNHHAEPGNYNFGRRRGEYDPTAWLIKNYFLK